MINPKRIQNKTADKNLNDERVANRITFREIVSRDTGNVLGESGEE